MPATKPAGVVTKPREWWWLSFTEPEGFCAVVIVAARLGQDALEQAWLLGAHYEWDVRAWSAEGDPPPAHLLNRLLTWEDDSEELERISIYLPPRIEGADLVFLTRGHVHVVYLKQGAA